MLGKLPGYATRTGLALGLIAMAMELTLALTYLANAGQFTDQTLVPRWTEQVAHRPALTPGSIPTRLPPAR